jgi:peptidoglycan/LPS O-acetylase OafA/YrhL
VTRVPGERVLGWDVLRGLCALGVASYHLLYWQDVAALHTLGSYGVYLFFVLSGASLAYTYPGRLDRPRAIWRFLATRWLRLAPLYLVACVALLGLLSFRDGGLLADAGPRLALNLSFAFGLFDPAVTALAIGGWSLGVEFVFYLAVPIALPLLARRAWWMAALAALTVVQWLWILRTAGSSAGYAASAVAYHQVPAFAAYFFGGCVIGAARRARDLCWPAWAGAAGWTAAIFLLLALNPQTGGDELLGLRGAVLFAACFATVFASGHVRLTGRVAPVARWLGDITYGCYLLHPLFFFGFAWMVWPMLSGADLAVAHPAVRWLVATGVLAASCVAAAASERWFEQPVRRWGQRLLARTAPPARVPHIDAASISS